jgi:hypothetical protein
MMKAWSMGWNFGLRISDFEIKETGVRRQEIEEKLYD